LCYYFRQKGVPYTFRTEEKEMKATITGTDSLSQRIILDLRRGVKVSAIPEMYPVSLDQAKRLSRYSKLLLQAEANLHKEAYERVKMLGLKVLPLAKLFRSGDWEGISEILSVVTDETTRDELELMIKGLEEKRERIRDFKEESSYKIKALQEREQELISKAQRLEQLQDEIRKEINFLQTYSSYDFLLQHVGLFNGQYVLAKRLDVNWQRSLRKRNVIRYDENDYVYYICDLDELVISYENRVKRGKKCLWDYDIDIERVKGDISSIPRDGRYKLPTGLAADLRSELDHLQQELKRIRAEQKSIHNELERLKKITVRTYMEAVEASNTLSVKELKKHGELQDKAMKWLYQQGYVVASEWTLPNGKRADVVGFNENGRIVIIEVKVSRADFLQDRKWRTYLDYCDEFFFLLHEDAVSVFYEVEDYAKCGLLIEHNKEIEMQRIDQLQHDVKQRDELIFSISRSLAKKIVYGY
jgi:hypothetical protein